MLRHPASLRPSLHIHVQSFGRFDEILNLVEKTSALTLPDLERRRSSSATSSSPNDLQVDPTGVRRIA
jgi:hypothetical protein